MNWHTRYLQQATWTRDLRSYLFDKAGLTQARRILEVGCGTGAVLTDLIHVSSLHGLDRNPAALAECRINVPGIFLTRGDGHSLPYPDRSFDIVYCHYFLLWARDPLQAVLEMKRVARAGGNIIALAEPDYSSRIDKPDELIPLGKWQTESLARQGADPSFGARLAETFFQAGIEIIEAGTIQSQSNEASADERELEWAVIKADLMGSIPQEEIRKMKERDESAWKLGKRVLHVPTYFCLGRA